MKPEIEKWYAEKKLPVDRIIDIGAKRFNITDRAAIVVALEEEYEHRMIPRKVPLRDIDIAWSVWTRARKIASSNRLKDAVVKFESDQTTITSLSRSLENVVSEYKELQTKFETKLKDMATKRELELKAQFRKAAFRARLLYWSAIGILLAYGLWFSGVLQWKA